MMWYWKFNVIFVFRTSCCCIIFYLLALFFFCSLSYFPLNVCNSRNTSLVGLGKIINVSLCLTHSEAVRLKSYVNVMYTFIARLSDLICDMSKAFFLSTGDCETLWNFLSIWHYQSGLTSNITATKENFLCNSLTAWKQ